MFFQRGITFNPDTDIGPLTGKVILVTGGDSGLGKQTILELAKHNPKEIWLSGRSEPHAQAALADIKREVPSAPPIHFLLADLSSLDSVRDAAQTFREKSDRLDILFLNAGIMMTPPNLTKDGYEEHIGINYMGHAYLTRLLLPTLLKTAEDPDADVRVVVISSELHAAAPTVGIDFDSLKTKGENMYGPTRYGQSKLANIYFARELARRYPQFTVSSLHPGAVKTNLSNKWLANNWLIRWLWAFLSMFMAVDVATGVKTQLWAATANGVLSGEYYSPIGRLGTGKTRPNDAEIAKKLWDWTERELEGRGN